MTAPTIAAIRERAEPRDALGNLIDPNNSWRPGCPWWFDTNAIYTRWRARHDQQAALAAKLKVTP